MCVCERETDRQTDRQRRGGGDCIVTVNQTRACDFIKFSPTLSPRSAYCLVVHTWTLENVILLSVVSG